jgi:hypothetical protein
MPSKKYKLNNEDGKKILKGACIAVGGALLTYITQIVGDTDFGSYTGLVVAIASILVNSAHKWLSSGVQ